MKQLDHFPRQIGEARGRVPRPSPVIAPAPVLITLERSRAGHGFGAAAAANSPSLDCPPRSPDPESGLPVQKPAGQPDVPNSHDVVRMEMSHKQGATSAKGHWQALRGQEDTTSAEDGSTLVRHTACRTWDLLAVPPPRDARQPYETGAEEKEGRGLGNVPAVAVTAAWNNERDIALIINLKAAAVAAGIRAAGILPSSVLAADGDGVVSSNRAAPEASHRHGSSFRQGPTAGNSCAGIQGNARERENISFERSARTEGRRAADHPKDALIIKPAGIGHLDN